MNDSPTENPMGESFAFFHWITDVMIPGGICRSDPIIGKPAGWLCLYCRQDWFKLQGRNWRLA